jgi:CzcA family heavy metal efflux pump
MTSRRATIFRFLAEQRRFVSLAVILLTVAGIWSALHLPSAIYPELVFPRVTVVVQGSSLGTRQVVFAITRPIEEAVSIVPGVTRVQSRSIRGGAEINVTFAPRTDMTFALQQTQARVNQISADLPPNLEIEIERLSPSLFPIVSYNLEGGNAAALYDIARYQVKPLISRVPGVGRVDVQGSDVREIEVVADPARLSAAGITYEQLADVIRQSTSVAAVGRLPENYRQYLIVTAQEAKSADDIAGIVVARGLRVSDLAQVTLGTEDHVRIVAGDGKPAALINITRQIGGNTVAIADSVARIAASLRQTLPPGVRIKAVYDQAALVRDAVKSVRDAMLIGAALAVLVLLVFLRHLRITAISASVIPLTLAITVFIMSRIGQSFNLMTLGAMAIAIGLVIDDAVVVTENIVRHLKIQPDREVAVREAVRELAWPVITSTITTVVVFLPLRLLEGVVGQFFAALSITLTIAVLVSLVLAMTIIPLLSEIYLRPQDTEESTTQQTSGIQGLVYTFGQKIDKLSDFYERTLARVIPNVKGVLATGAVLIALGFLVHQFVGSGFLPDMDEGAFVLDYFTPGGTALAETDREINIAEKILAATPEVTGTSRRTGAELGLFATGQNTGDVVARLKPESERSRSIFDVMDEVRVKINAAVPRMRVEFVQILSDVINDLAGAGHPVEVKLFGQDLDALERYAESLEPEMSKIEGIEDFYNGVSEPSAELQMKINEPETIRIGLTPEQVGAQVSGALLGVNAGDVRLDDRSIEIRVRAPDSVRNDATRLASLPIVSSNGTSTALGALATFTPADTRGELLRENQQQMIAMTSDVSDRALGDVMGDVKDVIAKHKPPAGIRVELGGLYASQREAFRSLLLVLALAIASVVAVMVIQFQSFVEPLVVLLAAPLSFLGAMLLLLITGTALNVSSMMGMILLVGLIVKNGIILLDFTRHRMIEGGLPLEEAIREAARIRLRPILMTTLCTLFGLLPLALGLGAGSELQKPLALAVIGGLALSTPITLYFVPTLLVAIRGRDFKIPSRIRSEPK